jgi:hypothetical protein
MPSMISALARLDAQLSSAPPSPKWIATRSGKRVKDTRAETMFAKKLATKVRRIYRNPQTYCLTRSRLCNGCIRFCFYPGGIPSLLL